MQRNIVWTTAVTRLFVLVSLFRKLRTFIRPRGISTTIRTRGILETAMAAGLLSLLCKIKQIQWNWFMFHFTGIGWILIQIHILFGSGCKSIFPRVFFLKQRLVRNVLTRFANLFFQRKIFWRWKVMCERNLRSECKCEFLKIEQWKDGNITDFLWRMLF